VNVLFLNLPSNYIREGRCQQKKSTRATFLPPLSLACTASLLREKGFGVSLLDCAALGMKMRDLREKIMSFGPDLLIVSTSTPSAYDDLSMIGEIRSWIKVPVAVLGPHATACDEEMLRGGVDFAVRGEPEQTCLELAGGLGTPDREKVPGISFMKDGSPVRNPPRPFIENLDELPFPARDLLPNGEYRHVVSGRPFTMIQTSRGCPHRCIFCVSSQIYGHEFRSRSVPSVMEEIREVKGRFGIRDFYFFADTFTKNRSFVLELCGEIRKREPDICWWTNSRVDCLDREMLEEMRAAGCTLVGLGYETSSREILDRCRKGISPEQSLIAAGMCREAKMEVFGFFVFGLPGETAKTMEETIRFAGELDPDFADFFPAVPYPGTELYEILNSEGLIVDRNWSRYDYSSCVVRTGDMSPFRIRARILEAYARFYLRPAPLRRLWRKASPLNPDGPAFRYLKNR
jgi:radical SAM superfamily enzyme YgiQ (UPF0313 family)